MENAIAKNVVYFHRHDITDLMYLALYLRNEITAQFAGVLWGNSFADFCTDLLFPYFFA